MKTTFFLPTILFIFLGIIPSLHALPAQVMIIRHGEKSIKGDDLSIKGKERAAALVPYFTETKELLTHGMPVAIYAMAASKKDSSERTTATVKPLADTLNLALKNSFTSEDYKKMVEEIKKEPSYNKKTVLICWDQHAISEICRAFGALQVPSTWKGDTFDRIWIVTIAPNGKTSFKNLPQRLLFGDSPN